VLPSLFLCLFALAAQPILPVRRSAPRADAPQHLSDASPLPATVAQPILAVRTPRRPTPLADAPKHLSDASPLLATVAQPILAVRTPRRPAPLADAPQHLSDASPLPATVAQPILAVRAGRTVGATLRDHAAPTAPGPLLQHALHLTLDPAQTQIHFTLGAFLHTVHGTFTLAQGALTLDPSTGAATGLILIHASTGQSGDAARDRDLQQKVLESQQYPDITFAPTRLDGALPPQGGNAHLTLHGVLRLHGQDHDLALPVEAYLTPGHFTATTKISIPYVAWGLHDPSNLILHVAKVVQLTIQTSGTLAGDLNSPPRL